jgi:inner membrane protein
MFVWGITKDREFRQETVSNEISEQWSRPQLIAGPIVSIPVEKTDVTITGEKVVHTQTLFLLPKKLSYTGNLETQILTRGVYETPVYSAIIKGVGVFDLQQIKKTFSSDTKILWDEAVVSINVTDTRGISSMFSLTWNDTQHVMAPSSKFSELDENGVHAYVTIEQKQNEYLFSFELPLKGSRELFFLPLAETTNVDIVSNWNAPNFQGEFLPKKRDITPEGFSAHWEIASYGKNIPQSWINISEIVTNKSLFSKSFGITLYQEVDFYTMVDRSIKYSILFICLTFLAFFMYEILANLRIHPIQYLLVGLAIALFYLLLLSFAEILGFLPAYILSVFATTILITGYCFSVFKAKSNAFSIMGLLIALYTYLYILLKLEELSLLFGSVLLFGVLATIMYITRNLDWYSLTKKQ